MSLDWDFPGDGRLDFLSAGRQNRDYSAAVCSLDWDNFYDRLGGGRFFRAMRDDMKRNYDYVLIDSRTGLSDVADICTIQLPDVLVVCFTLSDQSIEGAANVARQISGPVPGPEYPRAAGPDAHRGRREGEAGCRPRSGPDKVRALPGRADAGEVGAVLGLGRGPVQAVLRVRGDPRDVRR